MENELRGLVAHLEDSWNRYDSQAFASIFAEDADFIHILGAHYVGRQAIDKGHRVIWDTIYKDSVVEWRVEKIRALGDEAAIVFTESALQFFQGGEKVTAKARPTLVAQRRNGEWVVVAFQNTLQKDAISAEEMAKLEKAHPYQGSGPK